MSQSLFERYGGFARLSRVVSAFYDKVSEEEDLAPYFTGIDMRRLIDHQTKFIASILGGPAAFTNEQLERAHARLKIGAADFRTIVGLLEEALEEAGFDRGDIDMVLQDVKSRERFIVTRGSP